MAKQKSTMPWLEAITKVLEDANGPLHYTKVAEIIVKKHYVDCNSNSNIETTVNTYIQQNKGTFKQFGKKGYYVLKTVLDKLVYNYQKQNLPKQSLITAFGKRWSKAIFMQNKCTLKGRSITNQKQINDFTDQPGVYVLYNGKQLVYVGQSSRRSLSKRLQNHTADRLANKWDTFSWFVFSEIDAENGCKRNDIINVRLEVLIDDIEAILIESCNPQENKKQGNNWKPKEYSQI